MKSLRVPPLLLLLLLTACAAGQKKAPDVSPADLYQQAQKAVEKAQYDEAKRLLNRIREDSPFSKYAVDAELLSADAAFKDKKYDEAAAAYKSFVELHPTHPKVNWADYRRGLAYLNVAHPEDRDQSATRKAAEALQKLINADPNGPYTADARKRLAETRQTLAAHELYVARYYVRKKKYDSAQDRLRIVLRDYSETPANAEASKLMAELETKKSEAKKK